jgi:uncharacterized phage protein (TIGR02218 family)
MMLNVPDGLLGQATTLARCWRLLRRDGVVMGFTDHDRDITFSGVTHMAATGLEAADSESSLGLSVGGGEILGKLNAASLTESDIALGRYDGAGVETWLVDWTDPSRRVLLEAGSVGEIKRGEHGSTAEVRSIAHQLDGDRGRLFQAQCAAELGDARCGVNLALGSNRLNGVVTSTDGRSYVVAVAAGFADGSFTGGGFSFTTGANAGVTIEVKTHRVTGNQQGFTLWLPTGAAIVAGDRYTVTAGCDKQMATCRDRFNNLANFRGFPRMPGNDYVLRHVSDGEAGMDGGSLFA